MTTPANDLLRVAIATYNFTVDGGGAPGLITPAKTISIPNGALVVGAAVRVIVAPTSAANTATISIGLSAGGAGAAALKAALVVSDATWGLNLVSTAVVPAFTVGSFIKMSAAGNVTVTTATQALTAGQFDVFVFYTEGSVV